MQANVWICTWSNAHTGDRKQASSSSPFLPPSLPPHTLKPVQIPSSPPQHVGMYKSSTLQHQQISLQTTTVAILYNCLHTTTVAILYNCLLYNCLHTTTVAILYNCLHTTTVTILYNCLHTTTVTILLNCLQTTTVATVTIKLFADYNSCHSYYQTVCRLQQLP